MKRFFCFFIIFIMIFLSSCTDKKNDTPQSSLDRDAFLGTWLYEVYKNDEKYFGLIYEFEKTDGSYHGVIKKFDDEREVKSAHGQPLQVYGENFELLRELVMKLADKLNEEGKNEW